MTRVIVTGGSGKVGRTTVRRLVSAGYEVVNVDVAPSPDPVAPFLRVDLTDQGQVFDALKGAESVVHLAAISAPRLATDEVTFRTNVSSTWNVFSAAVTLGLQRVVWASSETVLGLPFDRVTPAYAPIDESHTRYPETAYALSKVTGEDMARHVARWSGVPFIGLRFSNVIEHEPRPGQPAGGYAQFPGWQGDPNVRKWNLWGYVDASDCALACHRALEADTSSWQHDGPSDSGSDGLAQVFIIAAADTVMARPGRELMTEVFPGTEVRALSDERATLQSIEKARRMLGYEPEHTWVTYAGQA